MEPSTTIQFGTRWHLNIKCIFIGTVSGSRRKQFDSHRICDGPGSRRRAPSVGCTINQDRLC
uniref:Uncharacterized protein n=1 Tax=Arundo donax TaxID=35708 RepID=A0A0A8ZG50_ARUDO